MGEEDIPAVAIELPRKAVSVWAKEKNTTSWDLAGAIGLERAARRWSLHETPVVTEAEFDAAVAAFRGVKVG